MERETRGAIRPMAECDLLDVARIEAATYPDPWPYESLAFELTQNPFCAAFVVEEAERVAGYAFLWVVYEQAHLINIAVDLAFRGRGYGQALLRHCMEYAARNGGELIHLEVREGNAGAIRLYEKHGFVVLGRKAQYYRDGEAALLMEAPLPQEPQAG